MRVKTCKLSAFLSLRCVIKRKLLLRLRFVEGTGWMKGEIRELNLWSFAFFDIFCCCCFFLFLFILFFFFDDEEKKAMDMALNRNLMGNVTYKTRYSVFCWNNNNRGTGI